MRILSLVVHKEPGFTFGGTLEVIAFGALVGVPSGLVYAFANKYVSIPRFWKGLIYGALIFVVLLIVPFEGKGAAAAFPQELMPVIVAMFAILFIGFGIILALVSSENQLNHRVH